MPKNAQNPDLSFIPQSDWRDRGEEEAAYKEKMKNLMKSTEFSLEKSALSNEELLRESEITPNEEALLHEYHKALGDIMQSTHPDSGQGYYPGVAANSITRKFVLQGVEHMRFSYSNLDKRPSTRSESQYSNTLDAMREFLLQLPKEKMQLMRAVYFKVDFLIEGASYLANKEGHWKKDNAAYWEAVRQSLLRNTIIMNRLKVGELPDQIVHAQVVEMPEGGYVVGYSDT